MKLYSKFLDGVDRVVGMILMVLMVCFSVIVVLQIIWRFCFTPFTWTEQVSRYLFVWSVMLAIPFVTRRGQDIAFDMLLGVLPAGVRKVIVILSEVLMLAFSIYWLYNGVQFCIASSGLKAAGIQIPYNWVYCAQPICATLLGLVMIEKIYKTVFAKKEVAK